jgi:uncharacterized protein (TIGR04141 family)
MHEGAYNQHAASTNEYRLLDKVNFRPGGSSQIEVCDLLTQDMRFICVKRETESATLSHLFSQASVSATLLNDLPAYRDYISNQLPAGWQLPDATTSGWKDQITFVYAVTSHRQGSLVDLLPFFSKVNLKNHARTITRMGFKVALRKIEVNRNTPS